MVNWDPKAQTALSNEEVIYRDEKSHLYHLKYYLENLETLESLEDLEKAGNIIHHDAKGYYAVVATTRPETIMGDTAMCINPKDPKNQWLKGRKVIVPLVGRVIPVIEDRYVDIEFGTGCLKVTPAHDTNDYMLGKKHNLETIDIFNPDGTISDQSPLYVGMDRMDVRRQIVKDLQAAGLVEKIEDYDNKVGYSERNSDTAVEPRLCMQWFLKMQHFADIALPPVMNDELKFYPAKYKTTYKNWLENIQDWCISRQLWWGHRIPAYFLPTAEGEEEKFVVALNADEALAKAQQIAGYEHITKDQLRQDEDALDTWFSSWLWPVSLFDGINRPGNEEISYYYPTSDLVTGPDIIFFWVARMIMAGYEYQGKMPFRNVYFTGIVRDKLGRKMSKSLGNSPDPIELIEKFGADGVRMGMMLSAPAGNDILFDEALCEQGRNFNNKIWNAFRLVKGWQVGDGGGRPVQEIPTLRGPHGRLQTLLGRVLQLVSRDGEACLRQRRGTAHRPRHLRQDARVLRNPAQDAPPLHALHHRGAVAAYLRPQAGREHHAQQARDGGAHRGRQPTGAGHRERKAHRVGCPHGAQPEEHRPQGGTRAAGHRQERICRLRRRRHEDGQRQRHPCGE